MSLQLSLIIATYNRADRITQCLDSLIPQRAEAQRWEAIVVNNNSSDSTIEVVEQFIAQNPNLNIRLVTERKQGLSHARNRGIEESQAPIIAIIDDDERIVPRYIESYINFFEEYSDVAAAGGAVIPLYDNNPPRWVSPLCEVPIANPIAEEAVARPFSQGKIPGGGNMAVRRSVLDKYGLFDPELGRRGDLLLGGEESNLFDRLRQGGEQVWFVPNTAIYHIISGDKLERGYLDRLWFNIGVSQVTRARIEGVRGRVVVWREAQKWCATLALAFWYLVTLRPSKGWYLILMRRGISRGIVSRYRASK